MTHFRPASGEALYPEEFAARLSGVDVRVLRSWQGSGASPALIYTFRDLVCLRVLRFLSHEMGLGPAALRDLREKLSLLDDAAWELAWLDVQGQTIAFVVPHPGEAAPAGMDIGHKALPLARFIGEMSAAVAGLGDRKPGDLGRIERKRGVMGGRPVIAGTRILVSSVQAFAEAGYSAAQIREQYPTLTLADVAAATGFTEAA